MSAVRSWSAGVLILAMVLLPLHGSEAGTQERRLYSSRFLSRNASNGLPSDDIRDIVLARGLVYLATGAGLVELSKDLEVLSILDTSSGLPDNDLWNAVFDGQRTLYLVSSQALVAFDLDANVVRTWTAANGLPSSALTDLATGCDGHTIFIGSLDGLIGFNTSSESFLMHNMSGAPSLMVGEMSVDCTRFFLLFTSIQGVGVLNLTSGDFSSITVNEGLPSNDVRQIDLDPYTGTFFVADYGDPMTGLGHLAALNPVTAEVQSRSTNRVVDVAATLGALDVFVSTAGLWNPLGFSILSFTSGTSRSFSEADGLPSNFVNVIRIDPDTDYVFLSSSGIARFNRDFEPPVVAGAGPVGSGISVASPIWINFSEPMNWTSIGSSLAILPSVGPLELTALGRNLTIVPTTQMAFDTGYTAYLSADATDLAGNGLLRPFTWTFRTVPQDTDGDGVPDVSDDDDDGDGIPDTWEGLYGLNPRDASDATFDSDSDGFSNFAEYENGTNPQDPQSRPGLPDAGGDGGDDGTRALGLLLVVVMVLSLVLVAVVLLVTRRRRRIPR